MALTPAERKQRSRKHLAGDHSSCDPSRCHGDGVTSPVTKPVTRRSSRTPGLGARGRRLWQEVTGDGEELLSTERVLLEEACRIADRLDRLDLLLTGDAHDWVRLVEEKGNSEVVEVVIDRALSEARQQATALKQIVAELRQSRAARAGKPGEGGVVPPAKPPSQPLPGGARVPGSVTDLTARITERRNQTAG